MAEHYRGGMPPDELFSRMMEGTPEQPAGTQCVKLGGFPPCTCGCGLAGRVIVRIDVQELIINKPEHVDLLLAELRRARDSAWPPAEPSRGLAGKSAAGIRILKFDRCDCGCGRPASVGIEVLDGSTYLVESAEKLESLIASMNSAAKLAWGWV